MLTRRPFRAIALLATTFVLAGAPLAYAQPAPPPPINDLGPAHPWTYQAMQGILVLALLSLFGLAVGYLVKSREFRSNQRRGGSK